MVPAGAGRGAAGKRLSFALLFTSLSACSPTAEPVVVEPPLAVEPPVAVVELPVVEPAVEPPVVVDPIFSAEVPDGPLRAVYGVYVDVEELSPPGLSKTERAKWQAARTAFREIRSESDARARWLTVRFSKALAKHQTKCMREGYGADPSCDADLVLCAQDNFVPLSITTTTTTATAARAAIAYDDGRTIAVDLIGEAGGWRIHAVKCGQRASSIKPLK